MKLKELEELFEETNRYKQHKGSIIIRDTDVEIMALFISELS